MFQWVGGSYKVDIPYERGGPSRLNSNLHLKVDSSFISLPSQGKLRLMGYDGPRRPLPHIHSVLAYEDGGKAL